VPADFALLGINQLSYTITSVAYDGINFRATLSISGFMLLDKYALGADDATIRDLGGNALDGEWMNNVTMGNSGDGTAGGVFNFHFNVSPGNYNRDTTGMVDLLDMSILSSAFGKGLTAPPTPGYNVFADGNGSGMIDLLDMSILAGALGKMLPPGVPGIPFLSSGGGGGEGESGGGLGAMLWSEGSAGSSGGAAAVDQVLGSVDEDDDEDYPVFSSPDGSDAQSLDEAINELFSG
jgi:hypothetical protein